MTQNLEKLFPLISYGSNIQSPEFAKFWKMLWEGESWIGKGQIPEYIIKAQFIKKIGEKNIKEAYIEYVKKISDNIRSLTESSNENETIKKAPSKKASKKGVEYKQNKDIRIFIYKMLKDNKCNWTIREIEDELIKMDMWKESTKYSYLKLHNILRNGEKRNQLIRDNTNNLLRFRSK